MTTMTSRPDGPISAASSASVPSHDVASGGPPTNVGQGERVVSVAAGAILALLGLERRSVTGLVIAGVGSAMIYRGVSGHCHAYEAMGLDSSENANGGPSREKIVERGVHIQRTLLINRPAEELYRYWRNFENLPKIMTHLQSVKVIDEKKSHWVVDAPKLVGGSVEWDAEIVRDEPNKVISWRSLPGAGVTNTGEVRFAEGPGDRGTAISVSVDYIPPVGRVGEWFTKAFGPSAKFQLQEDLRSFKRTVETGEVPTIDGQPQGSCAKPSHHNGR